MKDREIGESITERALALKEEFNDKRLVIAYLTIDGFRPSEIDRVLKEIGFEPARRGGFTQVDTLSLIEEGISERTLYETLINEGAVNELRWVSDRNKIRLLINAVYEKLGKPIKEDPAPKRLKDEAKEIVASHKKA